MGQPFRFRLIFDANHQDCLLTGEIMAGVLDSTNHWVV